MKTWKLIFVLTFIIKLSYALDLFDSPPIVQTDLGKVQGTWKRYNSGREYASFEGIPFAKPPLGKLRLKNPLPVEPWNNTLKAIKPYTCIQKDILGISYIGDEDCLYLNIYVPKTVLINANKSVDTIVHIHGGGFKSGSGTNYATPGLLMEKDIVFVTINYRLHVFGFLSTQDEIIPGNFRLKDQVMALKFIQQHIKCFGGNKDSVTLTGISAGAASVHFHYFSSLSNNLFHRGISQSGTAIDCWTRQEKAKEKAFMVGNLVGCPNNSSQELLNCLQTKPMIDVIMKAEELEGIYDLPIATFAPVVESNKSTDPFLIQDPYEMLEEGKVPNLPWIASTTPQEGIMFITSFINDLDIVSKNWTKLAPILLDFNMSLPLDQHNSTAQKIRNFYVPNNEDFGEKNIWQVVKMFSDRNFLVSSEQAVRMQAKNGLVHYYSLRYNGSLSLSKITIFTNIHIVDVTHGDDAIYQFPQTLFPLIPEKDREMKDLYVDFVVNFAKTGKPQFGNESIWDPAKNDELNILFLDSPDNIHLEKVDQLAPVEFWHSLGLAENGK